MAIEVPLLDLAFTADHDYSTTGQYLFVKITGDMQVGTTATAGDTVIGVLQNKPGSAQGAAVRVQGVSKVYAGATMTAGSLIVASPTSSGSMIATGNTSNYTIGIALQSTTGTGTILNSVFLTHAGKGA